MTPIVLLSNLLDKLAIRVSGNVEETRMMKAKELEDEIRSLVFEGQYEQSLDPKLREMIEGVIQLDDLSVRDIMRHRSEIDAIRIEAEWSDVLHEVVESGRTRLPIVDKSLDEVVGTLYVKDLLSVLSAQEQVHIRDIMRPVVEVPETMSLHELLKMFLQTKTHQAIVVDEFHATLGLVTIEDVLEEIVGEIVDESEEEEIEEIESISDNSYVILAGAHLDEINEQIHTSIPAGEDYNTLGGFLIKQLLEVPKAGTTFQWHDLRFVVEESSRRKIERIRLILPEPAVPEPRSELTAS